MKDSKPSVDEIIEIDKNLDTYYGPVQDKYKDDESFYDLEFKDSSSLYLSCTGP